MPDIAVASLALASFILLVAGLLGWREWCDRRARPEELGPDDLDHFAHQDRRRAFGLAILCLLAIGVAVGSGMPSRLGNRPNPPFVLIWLAVFALICILLTLALSDWIALRHYARRLRREILRERIEILREEARRRNSGEGRPE